MTRALITPARIRYILAGSHNENDAAQALRLHRVKYSFSTAGGVLHIRIPARSGAVIVTRVASRTAPLRIEAAAPAGAVYPYPVPRWTWDD